MDDFKKFYYAEPFKPFVIRLANGEKLPVDYQYNAGFNPERGTRIGVALPKYSVFFDVSEIAEIKLTRRSSNRPAKRKSGSAKRRRRVA